MTAGEVEGDEGSAVDYGHGDLHTEGGIGGETESTDAAARGGADPAEGAAGGEEVEL